MLHTEAGEARILREVDGRWQPIGGPLPPVEDDGLHDRHAHAVPVTYWHFSLDTDVERGDRVICRERCWQVLDRCGPRHHAVRRLRDYMRSRYSDADEWMAQRQVWALRRLDLG